jgi:hypothetical protein
VAVTIIGTQVTDEAVVSVAAPPLPLARDSATAGSR